MTNNLKEEIEGLLSEFETVVRLGKGETTPIPEHYIQEFINLINQKEKEARIDELEHIACCDYEPIKDDYITHICHGNHEDRIKQLKEELNKEEQ